MNKEIEEKEENKIINGEPKVVGKVVITIEAGMSQMFLSISEKAEGAERFDVFKMSFDQARALATCLKNVTTI